MDTLGQVRSVIFAKAQQSNLLNASGNPDARRVAGELGCSRSTVQRILAGRMAVQTGAFKPTPKLIQGLQRWLGLAGEADVWAAIEAAAPRSPIVS
jgi:transcriptional regulator with XRE-family HTH domain